MNKEDFVLSIKRAASAFLTEGPDLGDASQADWEGAYRLRLETLAKQAVDTKRTAKFRKAAAEAAAEGNAAGMVLAVKELEMVQQYDAELAHWRARAEAAEAKLKE